MITGPTISPSSAGIYYNEGSQTFTASASANITTSTTPAYITLTGNGNTYYYYNSTLNASAPAAAVTEAPTGVDLNWSLGGDATSYLTSTPLTGTSTTVTHTTQSPSDLASTLTVTASASGASNQTATATVIAYGPMAAPTISRSGNTISLATSSIGATIYYTTDGSTPTASSTPYTGSFDLTTSPTTVKAIAIRDGRNSAVTSETLQLQLAAPVITVSNTGLATISAEEGATIHYTTDGSVPTASSPTYTGPVQLTNPQIIMAIVVKANYATSDVAMADFITSGVTDGIVILDDREDHNWSYYKPTSELPDGYPEELCSPYPRNVKITYYGYGANTLSTAAEAAPAANTFNINTTSSDVKVGIGEDGHTFIYHKTLERDANGLYPYRMIFNPFYVRPKSGSTYTGFYKWRVKSVSGGSITNAGGTTIATTSTTSTNNVWLDADETYYFNPADNGTTNVNNVTSMTIEFEALWSAAEVITTGTFSNGYNSVERNFYVRLSNAAANVFSSTTPCTYSSFYPNGTTNGTTAAEMGDRVTVQSGTSQADSKVEYHIWSNTTTLNTGGFKVDIGRGMTASGNGPTLTPLSGTHNADKNARLRIETGTYNGGTSNLYGSPTVNNNLVHLDLILGSDYDRAKSDNTQLTLANANTIQHGAHVATGARWLSFQHLDIWVKSGRIQPGYFTDASASYNRTFYCRSTLENNNYPGISYLTVEGGEFASINGGRGNKTEGVALEDDIVFSLRIKGGTIHGSIYGAASANPSFGGRRVVMTGGMVEGWIAGGCDGTTSGGGATLGNAYFYIGGNAKVGNTENPSRRLDDTDGGNIFGAGRGRSDQGVSANPASMKNAFIVLADDGFVLRNIYGGGDYGYTGVVTFDGQTSAATSANFFVLGGTLNGSLFGGGNNNNSACTNANITMTGGLVKGGLYGGSNSSGIMTYNVNIKVNGGQVGDGESGDGVFGGGYGAGTSVGGNVSVTLGASTTATDSATVNGNVYGGSALGDVNTNSGNTTTVTMNKALINGNVFGGALGDGADVNGKIAVTVNGGTVNGNVYGGGDAAAYSPNSDCPVVNMTGGRVTNIFGGGKGNTAVVTGNPKVTLSGTAVVNGNVYGGGDAATVTGNTSVIIRD